MDKSFLKGLICFFILLSTFSCITGKRSSDISFFLPDGSECVSIIEADSLTADVRYMFRSIGDGNPYIVLDSLLIELGDSASSIIPLPFGREFDDIHWRNGHCFFSADSTLFFGDNDGTEHPFIVTDNTIPIFELTDDGIVFVKDSLLSFYSFKQKDVDVLYVSDRSIDNLEVLGESYLFSTGKDLFILDNKKLYHIYSADTEILSFVMHPNGSVFYGTAESVTYLNPNYESVIIVNKPAKDLTLIGDDLFITFCDNSSCMISNASSFYQSIDDGKATND